MEQHISELNGKLFYFSVWAGVVILVVLLFIWYYKKQKALECVYCGRNLHGKRRFSGVVNGVPKYFCDGHCNGEFGDHGPMDDEARKLKRSQDALSGN